MLMNVSKKIELIANVAIIVVACLLATVLVKNYLLTSPSQQNGPSVSESTQPKQVTINMIGELANANIKFPVEGQTLILAISSNCHFCTDSAAFYKKLVQLRGATRVIVVTPQSIDDARKYLDRLGVAVDEVRQLPLDRIGVERTPTLLLVDGSGIVRQTWVGKLTPEREQAVLGAL